MRETYSFLVPGVAEAIELGFSDFPDATLILFSGGYPELSVRRINSYRTLRAAQLLLHSSHAKCFYGF